MTSRELLIAASRGGEMSRRPVVAWPATSGVASDLVVSELPVDSDQARVVEVLNPFGRANAQGLRLNELLDADPSQGAQKLDALVEETRAEISVALESGADGVLYRLHGATPEHCTPMQYGGHYLERDRELLTEIQNAALNLLFVVGGAGVYVDFVSDLPAALFGWDAEASGLTSEYVRTMRAGAQISSDPASEVQLVSGVANLTEHLENLLLTTI